MNDNLHFAVVDAEEHMDVIADLLDERVHVTEYLSGRLWSVCATRANSAEGVNFFVQIDGENAAAKEEDEDVFFNQRLDYFLADLLVNASKDTDSITLIGQYLSPALDGNPYCVDRPEVRLFDLEVNGSPLDAPVVFAIFASYAVKHVPVLTLPGQTLGQWLDRRPLQERSGGLSRLAYTPRRGVVIRPAVEMNHPDIGRLVLKACPAE